ncbi:rhomboid-related protein 2 [Petromyzon marinus]|uniref:Rhomboid-related protein 2 n=1 Tax=Petromyzon marinus TaxID=7757 RepID=A0AAJ7XC94_PETMA|nr:rhomboid-related protein 2 [Petromyzon marinus]XP_032829430.1 rhomboid-related protein 2 [Petromyzon marinus]XP_032829431.1 rhomboid-related protein 2 [Petromyzon marinus]
MEPVPDADPEADPEADAEDVSPGKGASTCCPRCHVVHKSLSRWVLPPDIREKYLERANCLPPPIFIMLISLLELGVFIYYAVWKPQKQWITLDSGISNSPFIYRPDRRQEAWRFVSYMLVHAGVQHIINNLIVQLILGLPLELVHKGHRVGLVYLAGVVAGSLASSVFDPCVQLVGASGGGYALIGGYFMNVVVNFKEMKPLFGVFRLLFIGSIVLSDVGVAIYRRFIAKEIAQQVSFVAHIAGGLAGVSMGYVVFTSYDQSLVKDPRFWVCLLGFAICTLVAVAFNIWLSPAVDCFR